VVLLMVSLDWDHPLYGFSENRITRLLIVRRRAQPFLWLAAGGQKGGVFPAAGIISGRPEDCRMIFLARCEGREQFLIVQADKFSGMKRRECETIPNDQLFCPRY
jgi:hypothetical protein